MQSSSGVARNASDRAGVRNRQLGLQVDSGLSNGGSKGNAMAEAPAAPKTRERDIQASQAEEEWSEGDLEAGEEEEAQRQCILCGNVPSSIICLVCNHCVDIPCAAQLIIGEGDLQKVDLGSITCPECNQTTTLSQEVQQTILEYLESEELQFAAQGDEEQQDDQDIQYQEEHQIGEDEEGENHEEQIEDPARQSNLQQDEEQSQDQVDERVPRGKQNSSGRNFKPKSSSKNDRFDPQPHSKKASESKNLQGSESRPESKTQARPSRQDPPKVRKTKTNQSESDSTYPGQSQAQSEVSLHFACIEHPNEEYAFYSTTERKLYCASCLISSSGGGNMKTIQGNHLKPLIKSIP